MLKGYEQVFLHSSKNLTGYTSIISIVTLIRKDIAYSI